MLIAKIIELYLNLLFAELTCLLFKSFRLLPAALPSLQIIEVVVSVLDAVFDPNTITAAWSKVDNSIFHKFPLLLDQFTQQSSFMVIQ